MRRTSCSARGERARAWSEGESHDEEREPEPATAAGGTARTTHVRLLRCERTGEARGASTRDRGTRRPADVDRTQGLTSRRVEREDLRDPESRALRTAKRGLVREGDFPAETGFARAVFTRGAWASIVHRFTRLGALAGHIGARMTIRARFVLVATAFAVAIGVTLGAYTASLGRRSSERRLEDLERVLRQSFDRDARIEVETAVSMLQALADRARRGELPEEEAQKLGAGLLRDLRHGKDGYFWADTYGGVNVVLLGRKDEGKSRLHLQDARGKFLVQRDPAKRAGARGRRRGEVARRDAGHVLRGDLDRPPARLEDVVHPLHHRPELRPQVARVGPRAELATQHRRAEAARPVDHTDQGPEHRPGEVGREPGRGERHERDHDPDHDVAATLLRLGAAALLGDERVDAVRVVARADHPAERRERDAVRALAPRATSAASTRA